MKALFYKISPAPSLPKRGNPSLRSPTQPPAQKSLPPGNEPFRGGAWLGESGLRPGGKREVRRDFAR
ncbi:MAG: hypothetical protein A2V86_10200 [Deltaproteobacteria bacterium RBG_16_49_23]|nr:MAG: hypothetical protein A2V86_10200 [Deltaproteobacteria bacterium RBG_16_49_23]